MGPAEPGPAVFKGVAHTGLSAPNSGLSTWMGGIFSVDEGSEFESIFPCFNLFLFLWRLFAALALLGLGWASLP